MTHTVKPNRILLLLVALIVVTSTIPVRAQVSPANNRNATWELLPAVPERTADMQPWVRPLEGQLVRLTPKTLETVLSSAPMEFSRNVMESPTVLSLPDPDGKISRFRIVESPVMHPGLQARYPNIRTYLGQGIDDPSAVVRLDWTPQGFHSQVLSPNGAWYVDPFSRDDIEIYTSYRTADLDPATHQFECMMREEFDQVVQFPADVDTGSRTGESLRVYDIAIATTFEYTSFHGGTVESGLAAVVTALNRIDGIYENEFSVRMVLVENNDAVIFTTSSDPYTNNDTFAMLDENRFTLNLLIGSANFDVGHVFSTAPGGVAFVGSVCSVTNKAKGTSGSFSPVGDGFWVNVASHEMGHQFGSSHTFNGIAGNCGPNRSSSSAYEIGSGSTIMSYAGICSSDNIQSNADPYFVHRSFDVINVNVTGGLAASCKTPVETGNSGPSVNAGPDHTIPGQTPFELDVLSSSDPDGDPLTYCWEQRDLGVAQALSAADNGTSPIFRSYPPTTASNRYFPRLSNLLNNSTPLGEKLPTTDRLLRFYVTVRDNRAGGGGVNKDLVRLTVDKDSGPFIVTAPNVSTTLSGMTTVTWNVANTDMIPVECTEVNILLSTDSGLTYPTQLAMQTPNDGSEEVVLPNFESSVTTCRIRVQASNNVFFDISNTNFTIDPGVSAPIFVPTGSLMTSDISGAVTNANGIIEPGEIGLELDIDVENSGTGDSTQVVAILVPEQSTVSLMSQSVTYPDIAMGSSSFADSAFVFDLDPSHPCGEPLRFTMTVMSAEGVNSFSVEVDTGVLGPPAVTTASYTGPSVEIPDALVAGIEIPVVVSNSTMIEDVNIEVRISHSMPKDLFLALRGPLGQLVILSSRNAAGGAGTGYLGTIFDDEAPISISEGVDPYAGPHRPITFAGPGSGLSALNGEDAAGTWSLFVSDRAANEVGQIESWSIQFTSQQFACFPAPFELTGFTIH